MIYSCFLHWHALFKGIYQVQCFQRLMFKGKSNSKLKTSKEIERCIPLLNLLPLMPKPLRLKSLCSMIKYISRIEKPDIEYNKLQALTKMLFPAKCSMTSTLVIDIFDPTFVLQALKLLHHSPEFLPFVVFLSSPGSTALRDQLASSGQANHVQLANGQNGRPAILSSVCFFLYSILCFLAVHNSSIGDLVCPSVNTKWGHKKTTMCSLPTGRTAGPQSSPRFVCPPSFLIISSVFF